MRLAVIAACLAIGCGGAWALPDGFIEPSPSNATVKTAKVNVQSRSIATVNFTITNLTQQDFVLVGVSCTALIDDEPIETNATPVENVARGQKAYSSVNFLELKGNLKATAVCRIEYIRTSF